MVTMARPWLELIQSTMEAMVVVFPEPEGPVTRTNPDLPAAIRSMALGRPNSENDLEPGTTRLSTSETEPR
jgi:hypothetical protein